MKILILGASGMLGNTLTRYLALNHDVAITCRDYATIKDKLKLTNIQVYEDVDVYQEGLLYEVIADFKPDVVLNCIGIIKQLDLSKQYYESVYMNSLLPHKILKVCESYHTKLIHFSTDCIFAGTKGNYLENDPSDCTDLYGKSKYLGEIGYSQNALTLRTSIIGHELSSNKSLVDWFLSQTGSTLGYTHAIFSGLPTIEIAHVLDKYILPKINNHSGLYNLSVNPIDKYQLLEEVKKVYNKKIDLIPCSNLVLDRSLNSSKLQHDFGYTPPSWSELIEKMYQDYITYFAGKHTL